VAPFEAVFNSTRAYLQLQFYSGGTLRHYFAKAKVAPLSPAVPHDGMVDRASDRARVLVVPALRQLLSALVAVRALRIVHGDMKLASALVSADGAVALADFGLARLAVEALGSAAAGADTTRIGAGKQLFMAPEVAARTAATAAVAVYGFGVCGLLALAPGHCGVAAAARDGRAAHLPARR